MRGAPSHLRIEPWSSPPARDYFTTLAAHPSCAYANALGSQGDIDTVKPRQKPYNAVSQKKRPWEFDATRKAARATIHPAESTDPQQLYPNVEVLPGESAFISADVWLSSSFHFKDYGARSFIRTKAQQLCGPNAAAWMTWRLWFAKAHEENQRVGGDPWRIAEYTLNFNNGNRLIPARDGSTEIIEPRSERFFLRGETWTRPALLLTDLCAVKDWPDPSVFNDKQLATPNGRVMELSNWMYDERRQPVQILDRVLILQPFEMIALLRLEWDTGTDYVPGYDDWLYAYQRNIVQIRNPQPAEIRDFLSMPVAA